MMRMLKELIDAGVTEAVRESGLCSLYAKGSGWTAEANMLACFTVIVVLSRFLMARNALPDNRRSCAVLLFSTLQLAKVPGICEALMAEKVQANPPRL